jgi:hypothetical protein
MISRPGLVIYFALGDWYAHRVAWDGQNFRWNRKRGLGEIHPDNITLKAVVMGIVEVVQ